MRKEINTGVKWALGRCHPVYSWDPRPSKDGVQDSHTHSLALKTEMGSSPPPFLGTQSSKYVLGVMDLEEPATDGK